MLALLTCKKPVEHGRSEEFYECLLNGKPYEPKAKKPKEDAMFDMGGEKPEPKPKRARVVAKRAKVAIESASSGSASEPSSERSSSVSDVGSMSSDDVEPPEPEPDVAKPKAVAAKSVVAAVAK